ncbi:MAG: AbrB/MazE/SpoVT family DNA-binding domain-containing protein [Nitrospinae bacterium]|nr:AbrB/MazE/SpoVT family DNA-binding domain-containing protein [Nitrospinota bacterium]
MKTLVSERGQVVIPKKIRDSIHLDKGDELEVEVSGETIILKPVRRFKARKWRDYAGIGEGIVDSHLRDRKKEKADEDVYP